MLRYALSALTIFALTPVSANAACPGPQLEEFGYNHRPIDGVRPLVTVFVDFRDAPLNPARNEAFYRRLVFAPSRSVNTMFHTASNGNFYWGGAGMVQTVWLGDPAALPDDFGSRIARQTALIMRARAQSTRGARTVESYDRNGDLVITSDELTMLRITNSPVFRNGLNSGGWVADIGNGYTWSSASANVDEEVDLNGIAHELFHTLGFDDHIYGPNISLNYGASFFAGSYGHDRSPGPLPLDPYHRMRAGWIRPELIEMSTNGTRSLRLYGDSAPDDTLLFYSNARCAQEFFLAEYHNGPLSPGDIDRGAFDIGVWLWYVKPSADFSPVQFNWPPPILGAYDPSVGNHAVADYLVSMGSLGGSGTLPTNALDEFSPRWGDGSLTRFSISNAWRLSEEMAYVTWRIQNGSFLANITAINGSATPAPISLTGPYRLILSGEFQVGHRGVTAQISGPSGRFAVPVASFTPEQIELRPAATTPPGTYQITIIGPTYRHIETRGIRTITFR